MPACVGWGLGWSTTCALAPDVSTCRVIAFVGPSVRRVAREAMALADGDPELEIRPPARRGDIAKLVEERAPSTIALVDGTFYSYPSVGHAEIRRAIDLGWNVWGLSSMGAIRAAEMAVCGMRGYGAVFRRFADDPDFDDDEVALLHGAEAPYAALSEPMIHIRGFVDHLVSKDALHRDDAADSLRSLKERWFGDRTLAAVRALVRPRVKAPQSFDTAFAEFDAFRTKSHDLERFLAEKPWRTL